MLPPGYEDLVLCPQQMCLEHKETGGRLGPLSSMYVCSAADGSTHPVLPWGKKNESAEDSLASLIKEGYHMHKCSTETFLPKFDCSVCVQPNISLASSRYASVQCALCDGILQ